ncbi:MAG: hypothetical protein LAT75_09525 [Candidatus Cyclonatronum sp.]|uniref:hypothetical protein n=1 Tax=Cyclonatronum sp. TaxID=3024185 RepID=UPI0025B90727|nr:hypothetical protein [Cyclonatronum sp.]MCH8487097.1 hypothetical protein [Cyclonatronum sp.]
MRGLFLRHRKEKSKGNAAGLGAVGLVPKTVMRTEFTLKNNGPDLLLSDTAKAPDGGAGCGLSVQDLKLNAGF